MFSLNVIYDIIDGFAKKNMIFSNEREFQLEMAMALKKKKKIINNVYLEVLFTGAKKKEYIDIVVETKEKKYIAIELKYKFPDKECEYNFGNKVLKTTRQGAYYLGAYQYVKDIYRLSNIKAGKLSNSNKIKINKGYAILLTNDKNYRHTDFSNSTIWGDFNLRCEKLRKGRYEIKNKKNTGMDLNKSYKLYWRNYKLERFNDYQEKANNGNLSAPKFSYLVVVVQ